MKYFITGGTGFIGQEITKQLIAAGHTVFGVCRSEEKAEFFKSLGGEPLIGDIEDLELLKKAAGESDGVVHLAFPLNFADFAGSCLIEKNAIIAMCTALEGTNKPFIGTGGTMVLAQPLGSPAADEDFDAFNLPPPFSFRLANEHLVTSFKDKGVRAISIRLSPTIHGEHDKGFIPIWMEASKKIGWVPVINGGENIWPAAHKIDAANIYIKALESGKAGASYHAIAETNKLKDIGAVVAKKLGLEAKDVSSDEAPEELGFFGRVLGLNDNATSEKTKKEIGWNPTHPTLFEDIEKYYT